MILLLFTLASLCNECNTTIWELRYQGVPIVYSDMATLDECEELKAEIDLQVPAFTSLECVEVDVVRHDS